MNKFYTILFLFIISFMLGHEMVQAQNSDDIEVTRLNEKRKPVYWFFITLKVVQDKSTGEKIYNIRKLSPAIEGGKKADYERDLWAGMGQGQKIAIGPFTSKEQANDALELYDMSSMRKDHSKILEKDKDVFWFMVKVYMLPRSKSFEFERVPARVASGTIKEFEDALWEGIYSRNLFIGPFYSLEDAEDAKKTYRLEE